MITLDIQMFPRYVPSSNSVLYCELFYQAPQIDQLPSVIVPCTIGDGTHIDPSYPNFINEDTAFNTYKAASCAQLVTNVNTTAGAMFYSGYNVSKVTPAVSAAIAGLVTNSQLSLALNAYATAANVSASIASLTALIPANTDGLAEGTVNKYFTTSRNLATALTGFSVADSSNVTASDSLLIAVGKLQAELTATQGKFARTTSSLSLSLVGTGATGTQISATKAATVHLNISDSTTSTIGGPGVSDVDIKICATNSATESDWTTVASIDNEQTVTLAIIIQSIQVVKGAVTVDLNPGQFIKCVNTGSGTHTEAYIRGQQTIYG